MKIIKVKFRKEIFEDKFNGNYTRCAEALSVTPQHLHKYLTTDSEAGPNLLGGLALYCQAVNADFWDYIFLHGNSTTVESGKQAAAMSLTELPEGKTQTTSKLPRTG